MDQLRQGCGDDGMVSEVGKLNGYSAKRKLICCAQESMKNVRRKRKLGYIRSSTTQNMCVKLDYGTLDLLKEFFHIFRDICSR